MEKLLIRNINYENNLGVIFSSFERFIYNGISKTLDVYTERSSIYKYHYQTIIRNNIMHHFWISKKNDTIYRNVPRHHSF